ncbi:MAG: histidine phosphatase family protein [Rhodococcus sp. (in: high G+C Gram-positive bacteria)]|uniref:histidine phosphatase family protein n=1 Tax=Rhodococcus sp. TaxID=1831 RepID=UPI003BB135EE
MSSKDSGGVDLVLMRHGEPQRNDANSRDPGLSDVGWAQVRGTLPYLMGGGPLTAIYSSPQMRARQSARVAADAFGLALAFDDGLVEFDHGAPYVHYDDGAAPVWRSYFAGDLSPWGLTLAEFHARIQGAMNRIADRHEGGRVLAVCHGGVVNAWTCQILGVPDRIRVMEPGYASLHRYRRVEGRWRIVSLNEIAPASLDTALL